MNDATLSDLMMFSSRDENQPSIDIENIMFEDNDRLFRWND